MISLDNTTIVFGIIVLLLALITPWINIFVRRPKVECDEWHDNEEEDDGDNNEKETESKENLPPISIVITPHENARELDENLPLFLNQDYPSEFKVIVVAWKSDSDDEDVIKRYSKDPHLYTTYIPDSSRYMSRKKLAITIGVKAAKTEWIVMTDITSRPDTNQWLRTIAGKCTEGNNLVIGYTRYEAETPEYRRFERLVEDFYLMRETSKGKTYRCDSKCLAFRKSEFNKREGFRGNLKYLRGEYDFMANKYARPMTAALVTDPNAWMTEEEPTNKQWRNRRLFYIENRKHLERSARHRIPIIIDQAVIHINWLAIIATAALATLTQHWLLMAAVGLALLLTIILRSVIALKAYKEWDVSIPTWKTTIYETGLLWHHLLYRLRYAMADKNDFISHKI